MSGKQLQDLKGDGEMGHIEERFHQINAVIAQLEAAQLQCNGESVAELISVALNSAETLQEMMMKTEWPGMVARNLQAYQPAKSILPSNTDGDFLGADAAEYCFPV